MSIRDELAQEFKKHAMRSWDSRKPAEEQTECRCGWVGGDLLGHQLNEVSKRFGIVELPEPEKDKWGNPDFSNEHIRLTVYSYSRTQLEVPEYFGVNDGVNSFQLRDLAARCLAAANRAEAQP
ncbi:hypothetical protein [Rhodococcus sp. LW-XY12]|uniref:hypothetical protein n=1 Tax=Rhodococcus sp. LW-XY12 TaxID=2856851 RepID=UPI001C59FD0F|nr:hypothetical protein [Rhodococcus sp. LW-XY12]QXU53637.1 hypothetical protein KXC42_23420 [Rhodococcus sp. LW-XY12]